MDHVTPGFIRIIRPNGVAGNGFMVRDGLIVTCAHVVAEAIGPECLTDQPKRPEQPVEVAFSFADPDAIRTARVIEGGWFPAVDVRDGLYDIAVLRLDDPAPPQARPIALSASDRQDVRVRLFPYLPPLHRSVPFNARATLLNEFRELHVEAVDDDLQWIEPGVSGSPIFAEDEGAEILGMVVWRDIGGPRQAFAKPASVLRAALPEERREETGERLRFDVDYVEQDYANRDLVSFDIDASSQYQTPGGGIAMQFEASFDRFPEGGPRLFEVELHVDARAPVCERHGYDAPARIGNAVVKSLGDKRRPRWRITAAEGALSDENYQIAPLVCRIPDAREGDVVGASLFAFSNRAGAADAGEAGAGEVERGEADQDEVDITRRRIIERLRLKAVGEPDDEGRIRLGHVKSRVAKVWDG